MNMRTVPNSIKWVPDKSITILEDDVQKLREAFNPNAEAQWIDHYTRAWARGQFNNLDTLFDNDYVNEIGKIPPGQAPPQAEPWLSIYQLLQGFYQKFKGTVYGIMGPP